MISDVLKSVYVSLGKLDCVFYLVEGVEFLFSDGDLGVDAFKFDLNEDE